MPVQPKFVLRQSGTFAHQRSGWAYATAALTPIVSGNGSGVDLDPSIEINFCRWLRKARREKVVPYRRPWVGFVHCPPGIPRWHDYRYSPRYYFPLKVWQDSMRYCRGLITLSAWMRRWLEERVDVPVLNLKHPTETPEIVFDFERYRTNPKRRVIQIGWWMRRLCAIRELPVRRLRKTLLVPVCSEFTGGRFFSLLKRERAHCGALPLETWDVEVMPYQPAERYDHLLAENLVFIHLYGSVANNTIIECIVRNTPVLVNPLPSVVEYLGEGYPFYFETLEEAAAKAEDMDLVELAHKYLRSLPKEDLSGTHFLQSLAKSDLYRGL